MKTSNNSQSVIPRAWMILVMTLACSFALMAQDATRVRVRFADPGLDPISGAYTVRVQVAGEMGEFVGANLRFFYDASRLEFREMDRIAPGYGPVFGAPGIHIGRPGSGPGMFGFRGPAGYVNGSLELKDEAYLIQLRPGAWHNLCRLVFAPVEKAGPGAGFCPSLVWDCLPDGGGMLGGEGLVVAVRLQPGKTPRILAGKAITAESANWRFARTGERPYGFPESHMCLYSNTLGEEPKATGEFLTGLEILPNRPNPWQDGTFLPFRLGSPGEVIARLYTPDGRLVRVLGGQFEAGSHGFEIRRPAGMEGLGWLTCQWIGPDGTIRVSTLSLAD